MTQYLKSQKPFRVCERQRHRASPLLHYVQSLSEGERAVTDFSCFGQETCSLLGSMYRQQSQLLIHALLEPLFLRGQ